MLINRRKQKLIPTYELHVKGSWMGEVKDGSGVPIGEKPLQRTAVGAEHRHCRRACLTCGNACHWQDRSTSRGSGPDLGSAMPIAWCAMLQGVQVELGSCPMWRMRMQMRTLS